MLNVWLYKKKIQLKISQKNSDAIVQTMLKKKKKKKKKKFNVYKQLKDSIWTSTIIYAKIPF